jgi:hypothetical protein
LTPTRILTRRRLAIAGAQPAAAPSGRRRRRRTRGFVQVAGAAASKRLRLDRLGRAYLGAGAALVGIMFYLAVAAQITQSSYDIAQLQEQQRQLIADQTVLHYQEVTLRAPSQVQQQATTSGMQRGVPAIVAGQPVALDLTAPVGAPASDSTPLWSRMVAAVLNTVGATRDVMASTGK